MDISWLNGAPRLDLLLFRRTVATGSIGGQLQAIAYKPAGTRHLCYTIEPSVRYWGQGTRDADYGPGYAIAPGTYRVKLSHSFRFRRVLPEIIVPGRRDIRMYAGRFSPENDGCVLVTEVSASSSDMVARSKAVLEDVIMPLLMTFKGEAWITVMNSSDQISGMAWAKIPGKGKR